MKCLHANSMWLLGLVMIAMISGSASNAGLEKATFAGGCFWCMEGPFERLDGIVEVVSGYTGGHVRNPSYEDVCSGTTGHYEAVQVTYDPSRIAYEQLLEVFWRQVDPTDPGGQFADRGPQYRTAIFHHTEMQKELAERSRKTLDGSGIFKRPVVTEIMNAPIFYEAEEYHQGYYRTCSVQYKAYRSGSGREGFLDNIWGERPLEVFKNDDGENMPQECGTERAFDNEFWNNKREGIYVDIVTGEPLFSSRDKFDSGTGWPRFIKPIDTDRRRILKRRGTASISDCSKRKIDPALRVLYPPGMRQPLLSRTPARPVRRRAPGRRWRRCRGIPVLIFLSSPRDGFSPARSFSHGR